MFSLLFLFVPFNTQSKPNDVYETMSVNYVLLDVTALNEDGSLVTDLTKDDFIVKENRDQVEIDMFDVLDFRESLSEPIQSKTAQGDLTPAFFPEQTLILLLDLGMANPSTISLAFVQLNEFFKSLVPRKNLKLYIFSLDKGNVTTRFTSNTDEVLTQFNTFEQTFKKELLGGSPFRSQTQFESVEKEMTACLQIIDQAELTMARITNQDLNSFFNCLSSANENFAAFNNNRSKAVMTALKNIILGFSKFPGLKSFYFVSPGFSLTPGNESKELGSSYAEYGLQRYRASKNSIDPGMQNDNSPQRGIDSTPRRPKFSFYSLEKEYQELSHLAVANRVLLHTFRIESQGEFGVSAERRNAVVTAQAGQAIHLFDNSLNEGLKALADTTGGQFSGGLSLSSAISKTLDQNLFHYSIGFKKGKSKKNDFKKIQIECKRKGVTLRYRKGYYSNPKKN